MFKMFSFSTFSTFCIGQVYCSSHDQFIYCDILSWVTGMDGIQKCVPATKIIANPNDFKAGCCRVCTGTSKYILGYSHLEDS